MCDKGSGDNQRKLWCITEETNIEQSSLGALATSILLVNTPADIKKSSKELQLKTVNVNLCTFS